MKKLGEFSLSIVPNKQQSREYWRAGRIRVAVVCKQCGYEKQQSQAQIRRFHGYLCWDCYTKGQDELLQAKLALAQRKREMKRDKR
jgi:hypothetical protein